VQRNSQLLCGQNIVLRGAVSARAAAMSNQGVIPPKNGGMPDDSRAGFVAHSNEAIGREPMSGKFKSLNVQLQARRRGRSAGAQTGSGMRNCLATKNDCRSSSPRASSIQ
jgi:hypothetical protein